MAWITCLVLLTAGGRGNALAASNVIFPVTFTVSTPTSPVLVDDAEDGNNQNALGGYWYNYCDSSGSHVYPTPFAMTYSAGNGAIGSNYFIQMTGNVVTGGYIGTGTMLNASGTDVDLNQYTGIRLYVKGNSIPYRLKIISSNISDYNYWGYNFTPTASWQQITIPWTSLTRAWVSTGPTRTEALTHAVNIEWSPATLPQATLSLQVDEIWFTR